MADVMMKLGRYKFTLDTAAYQEFSRATEYRWAAQSRVGQHDALQFTGYGEDAITLSGRIYPGWKGGPDQIRDMRDQAGEGEPLMMVDGNGYVHGRWVILNIEERGDTFAPGGVPRRQRFTLKMRYYDDGADVSNA
ncbi:phage tail protein [Chromohalobacter sp. 48-RD10]|uniref:phage tail protein n=1 Tax=Chromohalobacter sp. 48-RD10 TaxID=2994063 RepID=UPI0024688DC4|nr:phage tail protein [Chromohalobacter sp. 48-RD10]